MMWEQLVDISQTRAIGDAINYAKIKYMDGKNDLKNVIDAVINDLEKYGLDILSPFYGKHPGYYAKPRNFELAAAINRLRSFKVKQN